MPRQYRPPFYKKARTTAASKIQAAVRRKKATKAKGLTTIEKKQVKSIVASRKELKYTSYWYNHDNYDPNLYTPLQLAPLTSGVVLPNVYDALNGTVSIIGLQTGAYLNSASAQLDAALTAAGQGPIMTALGGYGMPTGDTSTTIDGNYAYFHSGRINLQINSIVASGNGGTVNDSVSPLCFRVIHVKAKADAAGTTPSLSGDLFRDMINNNAGLMSDMTLRQLMNDYGFNRDRFQVCKDVKFKLQEPVQPGYAGYSANQPIRNLSYPSQKNLTLWLDKPKKKLRFNSSDNGLTNQFEPLNYDFVNYIFVLCCREQTTNGEYSSTAKRWTLTTQGQTKFRDA